MFTDLVMQIWQRLGSILLTTAAELSEKPEGAACNGERGQPGPRNRSGNGNRCGSCRRHIGQPDPSDG
jgi:hypothetical protein